VYIITARLARPDLSNNRERGNNYSEEILDWYVAKKSG